MTPEETRKHWTPQQWLRHAEEHLEGTKESALCLYLGGRLTFEEAAKIANADTSPNRLNRVAAVGPVPKNLTMGDVLDVYEHLGGRDDVAYHTMVVTRTIYWADNSREAEGFLEDGRRCLVILMYPNGDACF